MSNSPAAPPTPPTPPEAHCLALFADCVNLALVLADDFDHVHVAALTDRDGHVADGVLLSEPWHTIDHAVGYALCIARSDADSYADLTLISVGTQGAESVRDVDVKTWRRTLDSARDHIRCRDWILTDGSTLRSMAATTGSGNTWRPDSTQPD